MKKKFTVSEFSAGELAVRDMCEKARKMYGETDLISVVKYIDLDAGDWDSSKTFKYAIIDCGEQYIDLTFEEAEKILVDQYDSLHEEDDQYEE